MHIRNRSGVDLSLPQSGLTLAPGQCTKVSVQGLAGVLRHWMGDGLIELVTPPDAEDLLWKDEAGLHVLWLSPLSVHNGYGVAAEALAASLVNRKVNLYGYPSWFEWHAQDPDFRALAHQTLRRATERNLRMGIAFTQPGHFRLLPTPYKIGYTMYESDAPLATHPEWKHECRIIDRLWVPSDYCKTVFSQFAQVPIDVVPIPIHDDFFVAEKRRTRQGDAFTFGMHGYLTMRKSPIETIAAFQAAFPRKQYPNVRLELKTWNGMCGYGVGQLPPVEDERVLIYNEAWSREELVAWLLSLDAYLFPSRGEGFGLPPREALASGLPVIVANNSGLTDVADNNYTYPVPCGQPEPSPLGGNWSPPNYNALVEIMREVYEHHDAALQRGRRGAQWLARWSSKAAIGRTTAKLLDTIDPLSAAPKECQHVPVEDRFLDLMKHRVPPGSRVLVIESTDLRDRLRGLYQFDFVADPYKVPNLVGGGRRYAACVSWGWYQRLFDAELNKFARYQLKLAPVVLAGVPSVRADVYYSPDSRYMRPTVWRELLARYVVEVHALGQFDAVVVQSPDDVPRGIVYRR